MVKALSIGGMATVEGEMGVARFLVNYFKRVHFQAFVAVQPFPAVLESTANGHRRR